MSNLFYEMNLYAVFATFFILLLVVSQIGFTLGRFVKMKSSERSSVATNLIPSTILGLVSLIFGFTFSMAINRYEQRKHLVLKEANAIGTTYLRSRLLNPPHGQEIRDLLKLYVDARLDFFKAGSNSILIDQAEEKSILLQNQLWDQTIKIVRTERGTLDSQFVSSLGEVIVFHAERAFALKNTIPEIVYWMILLIASLGMSSLSFSKGVQEDKTRLNLTILAFVFACVFTLIHDLDRPRAGTITESQDAMKALTAPSTLNFFLDLQLTSPQA